MSLRLLYLIFRICSILTLLPLSTAFVIPVRHTFLTGQTTNNLLTSTPFPTTPCSTSSSKSLSMSSNRRGGRPYEDIVSAVHRKEYEMKLVNKQHESTTDPVRMAICYGQESGGAFRLAKALRRVYDDPHNKANPNYIAANATSSSMSEEELERQQIMAQHGMVDMAFRRPAFCVDIKRKSLSRPGEVFCRFDDASLVAEAMVKLGVDVVFINVDYPGYGGDLSELRSAVKAVHKASSRAAVVMKDIVVDEIQLGLAKEAGADGILLIASVLGPSLEYFLDLATTIGLEVIVECHTHSEVKRAMELMAMNILVSNYDRVQEMYYPDQAINMATEFPGSGGPIICIAGGGIDTPATMKRHLAAGYDAVVVGRACMGNKMAPKFIQEVRGRTFLPAEFAGLVHQGIEFDSQGNPIGETLPDIRRMNDDDDDGDDDKNQE